MTIQTDCAGHRYVEFDMSDEERIRATYVPYQDWAKGPTIRIHRNGRTQGASLLDPGSPPVWRTSWSARFKN